MKKVLAIVLAFAMLLPVLSVNVFATDVYTYDFGSQSVTTYTGILPDAEFAKFVKAIQMDGAKISLVYTVQTDGWIQLTLQGNANAIIDGSVTGESEDQFVSGEVAYLDGSPTEEDRTYTISGADLINNFTKLNDTVCNGTWDGRHVGDYYRGMIVENLMGITINTSGALTLKSITVSAEGAPEPEEKGKVRIGDKYFDTLVEAVDAAKDGDTIYLLDDMEGAGIGIFAADVKDLTIDFGGNTYTCIGPAVGSSNTKSQAFHLEKSDTKTPNVTLQNGTLTATAAEDSGVKMLIQNYCDLTLTNMNLIGTTDTQYVLSNNFGNTVIDGNTSITATAGNVAFDVCYANGSYKDGVSVTVNTTGTITGDIELGTWNAAGGSNPKPDINDYLKNAKLIINNVKLEGKIKNNVGGFNDYEPDNAGGTDEEKKAEYNEKLQKAIDINGGTFAAGSKVENYLPEGGYKTDAAGNIIVGKKNDSNRITGCVYLNEDYHALIVNGRFIAQPHVDNGTGFCVACKGAINK